MSYPKTLPTDLRPLWDELTQLAQMPPGEALGAISRRLQGRVVFSTSFSWEDQAITHLIADNKLDIRLFTLDTGRLFPETYSTWTSTLERYGLPITAWYPDADELRDFVASHGPNAFYASVENRLACCRIRKVKPLQQALKGAQCWITGIRAAHSPHRTDMLPLEWDESNRIIKFHPLLHWSTDELLTFIRTHQVPYNPLHDKGFVSIGCAPCTRAVRPGEDFRAGRWWWENSAEKECGLHLHR